jgi:hypothetical protein
MRGRRVSADANRRRSDNCITFDDWFVISFVVDIISLSLVLNETGSKPCGVYRAGLDLQRQTSGHARVVHQDSNRLQQE